MANEMTKKEAVLEDLGMAEAYVKKAVPDAVLRNKSLVHFMIWSPTLGEIGTHQVGVERTELMTAPQRRAFLAWQNACSHPVVIAYYAASRLTSPSGETKAPPALEIGDRVKVITGGLIGASGTVDKHEEEGLFRVELDSGGHYAFTANELLVMPLVPASSPAAQNHHPQLAGLADDIPTPPIARVTAPEELFPDFWNGFGNRMVAAGDSVESIAQVTWHAAKAGSSKAVLAASKRFCEKLNELEAATPSTPPSPKTQHSKYQRMTEGELRILVEELGVEIDILQRTVNHLAGGAAHGLMAYTKMKKETPND